MDLPVEITEAFTDMGLPLYEWIVSGYCHSGMVLYGWYLGPIG